MDSFGKTLEILETVVLQNGNPVTPSAVAEMTGLHLATCSRIMVILADKGYLEQVSRREGYIAGPMTVALGTRHNPYSQLAAAARTPIRDLANAINAQVNLSVLSGKERIMLVCECPRENWRPWARFRFPPGDALAATERLLEAAQADNREKPEYKEIFSARRIEYVIENQLTVMGNLICVEGFPAAALGFGVEKNIEQARELANNTAAEICKKLSPLVSAY